ncbi:MAG: MBOAT family protein, partial [Dysosmobacter sp.]|nr:MBOAT family protein [Dysosmobacter sp.]
MLFNSFRFLIFFPCVFFLYYALPFRFRKYMLLAASYYFYMCWKPEFIVLILLSTAIDYFCGLGIGKHRTSRRASRAFLAVSLFMNLGLLFFFKYFNFFGETLTALCRAVSIPFTAPALEVILPVGISFYTFQTLSYTIDVYRGRLEPERDFVSFALFVSFFPQLVAGPIETAANLLPQLKQEHPFSYDNAAWGLKLMAWGFFKKLVVADRLAALFVDPVCENPAEYSGGAFAVAAAAFAIQIYCDFGGYSDIARGCAKTMGVDLMVNFKAPYLFSASVTEYWKRNHISLSEWFHDYVYISLGGNRKGPWKRALFVTVTFFLSGLWHGAGWTFVIWGLLQALYLNVESIFRRKGRGGPSAPAPLALLR